MPRTGTPTLIGPLLSAARSEAVHARACILGFVFLRPWLEGFVSWALSGRPTAWSSRKTRSQEPRRHLAQFDLPGAPACGFCSPGAGPGVARAVASANG